MSLSLSLSLSLSHSLTHSLNVNLFLSKFSLFKKTFVSLIDALISDTTSVTQLEGLGGKYSHQSRPNIRQLFGLF